MLDVIEERYFQTVVERDGARAPDREADRYLSRIIGKLREPVAGETLLDVGSGTGVLTRGAADFGLDVTGIEPVEEFVEVARAADPRSAYHVGSAENLPFEDDSFDFVTLISVLEHVQDWRASIRESVRVLRPGGVLAATTTNRFCPKQDEIHYFVGFGYYPDGVRRRIYRWAMAKHPKLVEHTHLPAYHWFSYGQLATELRRHRMEPFNWFDLLQPSDIPQRLQRVTPPIMLAAKSRLAQYLLFPATVLVARKPAR